MEQKVKISDAIAVCFGVGLGLAALPVWPPAIPIGITVVLIGLFVRSQDTERLMSLRRQDDRVGIWLARRREPQGLRPRPPSFHRPQLSRRAT